MDLAEMSYMCDRTLDSIDLHIPDSMDLDLYVDILMCLWLDWRLKVGFPWRKGLLRRKQH